MTGMRQNNRLNEPKLIYLPRRGALTNVDNFFKVSRERERMRIAFLFSILLLDSYNVNFNFEMVISQGK